MKIDLFDGDWYPRAIRTPKWCKKGAKMAPKWHPKRFKNLSKNMMDFFIDFEAVLEPPSAAPPPKSERAEAVEGVGGGINPSPRGEEED